MLDSNLWHLIYHQDDGYCRRLKKPQTYKNTKKVGSLKAKQASLCCCNSFLLSASSQNFTSYSQSIKANMTQKTGEHKCTPFKLLFQTQIFLIWEWAKGWNYYKMRNISALLSLHNFCIAENTDVTDNNVCTLLH